MVSDAAARPKIDTRQASGIHSHQPPVRAEQVRRRWHNTFTPEPKAQAQRNSRIVKGAKVVCLRGTTDGLPASAGAPRMFFWPTNRLLMARRHVNVHNVSHGRTNRPWYLAEKLLIHSLRQVRQTDAEAEDPPIDVTRLRPTHCASAESRSSGRMDERGRLAARPIPTASSSSATAPWWSMAWR